MNINKGLLFLLGAGLGSLVTWKFVEEKYRRIADEEIESVIAYYKQKEDAESRIVKIESFDTKIEESFVNVIEDVPWSSDEEKQEYEEKVNELEYSQDEEDYTVNVEQSPVQIEPYVISPEEFGEFGNDVKSWTYYADFVLTDDLGEIVSEPENIIGDALEHFGEYEDDCVHVRNENLEWDIEILKHEKTFTEINKEDE